MRVGDNIYYEGHTYQVDGIYREWRFWNQDFNNTDEIEVEDYPYCRLHMVRYHKKGSDGKNVPLLKVWNPESKQSIKGHLNVDDIVPNPGYFEEKLAWKIKSL